MPRLRKAVAILIVFTVLVYIGFILRNVDHWNEQEILKETTGDLVEDYSKDWDGSSILQNDCKLPIISPNESDLRNYVQHYGALHCNTEQPNIVFMDSDGRVVVNNELEMWRRARIPPFKCFYRPMGGALYPNISTYDWLSEKIELPINEPTIVPHDQFVVQCHNHSIIGSVNNVPLYNKSIIYLRAFATFPVGHEKTDDGTRIDHNSFNKATSERPSLSILILDSTARNQFLRHMKRTVKFMEKLGFVFLEGYNKIGDNSAVNLLPILAGKTILPRVGGDGREVVSNGTVVDLESEQFIWDFMQERRCVTMMNDDILDKHRGLFHYPSEVFVGFSKPPTHYYFRPFHLFNAYHTVVPRGGQCTISGQVNVESYLDIWESFSMKFQNVCHFSFNFLTGLTHDESSFIEAIDKRLTTSLKRLYASGVMENTAFVIMGDHGNRIGNIQRSYIGRIEERSPLFSIKLPEKFKEQNQDKYMNLLYNSKRLTSNFDIHQTLKDIAKGEFRRDRSYKQRKGRGLSLLDEVVSTKRTCEEAGIPVNFCLCMETQPKTTLKSRTKVLPKLESLTKEELSKYKCLNVAKLNILENRTKIYGINQMVRFGLRNQSDWWRYRNAKAALEILFYEIVATVPTKIRSFEERKELQILLRAKHYVREDTITIGSEPLILRGSHFKCGNTTNLTKFCIMCNI